MGEATIRLGLVATVFAVIVGVGLVLDSGSTADAQACHASYTGACLQVGIGDYDCAGETGDGPNYVDYRVQVVGIDEFGLDGDGDGVGCESLPSMPAQEPPPEVVEEPQEDDSSEVAGVSEPPVAGFGPGDVGGNGMLAGVMAGLIGAGIAWLMVGGAGAGVLLRRRQTLVQRGFVPHMQRRG